jgi:hypothetical protein
MNPEIVAQVLNHELEPHGLEVILSTSETARGFELYRADDVSPVGVTSADSPGVTLPKRFDLKVTSAEIIAWWGRHQVAAAILMQAPVSQALSDGQRDFKHYHWYKGASLEEALHAQGLHTVGHVVGLDDGMFWHSAIHRLSPVFGLNSAADESPHGAYLERKGLAESFVTTAERLVAESVLSADRYVLTVWKDGRKQKIGEYVSICYAVTMLPLHQLDSPELYLKAIDDHDFDARLLAPKDWTDWETVSRYRNDPAADSLASTEWDDDRRPLRYVSPIPDLETFINNTLAIDHDNHDLDELRVAAVEAITRFKSTHSHVRSSRSSRIRPRFWGWPTSRPIALRHLRAWRS